jgi:antitoxin component of MazEF toxin-antitoxin module
MRYELRDAIPKLVVRRTANSLELPLPRELVRDLSLAPGDEVGVKIECIPSDRTLAGRLQGGITADEFVTLRNEGEEFA